MGHEQVDLHSHISQICVAHSTGGSTELETVLLIQQGAVLN